MKYLFFFWFCWIEQHGNGDRGIFFLLEYRKNFISIIWPQTLWRKYKKIRWTSKLSGETWPNVVKSDKKRMLCTQCEVAPLNLDWNNGLHRRRRHRCVFDRFIRFSWLNIFFIFFLIFGFCFVSRTIGINVLLVSNGFRSCFSQCSVESSYRFSIACYFTEPKIVNKNFHSLYEFLCGKHTCTTVRTVLFHFSF